LNQYFVHLLRSAPGLGEGWEDFLVFYFTLAFQKAPLHHVFTFHGTPPPLSEDSAKLVALLINNDNVSVSRVDVAILTCRSWSWLVATMRRTTLKICYCCKTGHFSFPLSTCQWPRSDLCIATTKQAFAMGGCPG
jgi:hypothetical protein